MRRLKAVFFDLDDTLVLTEDCDRAAFACVAQLAEELLPGCNGRRLVNEWRPLFYASPWCPEGKHFRFGEGVEPMVAALQQRGLQTVVITNGHATVQRQKLEACAAGRLFRHILVGGEEVACGGHEKPHPSIFHKACSLAGCLPEEAVHVGDSLVADVNGALRAGLAAAVWINRNGERPVPTGLRPAAILSSVLELPSALEQLQLLPQQEA
ncbi:hypothetical protein COHA_001486 [Chlorella ohadii]|uniref:N-acylneuraminate-9-phosphatase n=1 Tax=Chlorella ohadii TaxID=2649997 RepID=A0AAD5DUZ5_9CHLO|nr:hypothetical protein COHA_001486 [Chlorella ohadii]